MINTYFPFQRSQQWLPHPQTCTKFLTGRRCGNLRKDVAETLAIEAPGPQELMRSNLGNRKTSGYDQYPPGKHTKNYGKWWFIVDLPIKNGDFPYITMENHHV